MYQEVKQALLDAGFQRMADDFLSEESAELRAIELWITDASNGKPFRQILVYRDGFAENGRCAVFARVDQSGANPDAVREFIANGYDLISPRIGADTLPTGPAD